MNKMDQFTTQKIIELEDLYNEEEKEIKVVLAEDVEALLLDSSLKNLPGFEEDLLELLKKKRTELKNEVKLLRKEISTLFDERLRRFGVEKINIALMGRMGSSKSTLINGFYQALHEKYISLAKADSGVETVTKGIKPTSLANQEPNSNCPYRFINILDIFGEDEDKYTEEFLQEYFNGKINFTFELEENNDLPREWQKKFLREKEKLAYMPHVVIYLFELSNLLQTDLKLRIRKFFDMVKVQGTPGFGLGTKIDSENDFDGKFFSSGIMKKLNVVKQEFGFNSVYPMANYTEKDHIQEDVKDFMYLYILKRAILLGQEYINYSREYVELIDQYSTKERYIILKSLHINLAEFQKELEVSFPNDNYRVDLDENIDIEKIMLRSRLKPKLGEPYISQIIIHKEINVNIDLDKPRVMPVFPKWTIKQFDSELESFVAKNNIKKPKDYTLENEDKDNKPFLNDYIIISKKIGEEDNEYSIKVKPKGK